MSRDFKPTLIAYSVQRRGREIGIRLALGAEVSAVRNMIIFQGRGVVLIGVVGGCAAALSLTHVIAGFLFGIKSHDPVVFLLVPILLSTLAFFAVSLPAQKVSHIDPVEALRQE